MPDAFHPYKLGAGLLAVAAIGVVVGLALAPSGTDEPPAPVRAAGCRLDLAALSASSCRLLKSDTGAARDPRPLWGRVDCANDARQQWIAPGFRRLTVIDGDNVFGERCELGLNDYRANTFSLYREGQHRITFLSLRLPANFPLSTRDWQVVMQMKQTQPAENSGTGTPVIALHAEANRWRLFQSSSAGESGDTVELWSAPATAGRWTRFAFDVVYSQNTGVGRIKVYADLNGDGDAADPGEQSPAFATYTLKYETESGDYLSAGDSIPSHLRAGVYHDSSMACPPGVCSDGVDNVQVVRAQ